MDNKRRDEQDDALQLALDRITSDEAAASEGSPAAAIEASWKTVLIGISWLPVRSYSSCFGISANTFSIAPWVRSSR